MKYLNRKNILITIPGLMIIFILTILLIPVETEPDPSFFSKVVLDKNGNILRVFLNKDEQWVYPDTGSRIPEKLKKCVLEFEDRRFYSHFGVDPAAVLRAAWLNISEGSIVSGGSTLTMQLARLKDPKPRTYLNKIVEMFQSFKLELFLSKEEILRQYLLYAPYGRNIIGYQTASFKYFGKNAEQLSWSESALLAILPNSPGQLAPGINQGRLVKKRNSLLKQLAEARIINKETLALSLEEKIIIVPHSFPKKAPHLTRYLSSGSDQNIITSTIDTDIQNTVKDIVKRHAEYLQSSGINNMAVLIAETDGGKVRAYIGSQDYWDNSAGGKVDGIRAARSSGSILKPFLYAKAVDEGIICERSLLEDVQVNISSFSPQNANDEFSGLVRAKEALTRSLNVPAVLLLKRLGLYYFYGFLEKAGMTTLYRRPDDYGLTLIIGGAEASLWDMVTLYRGLGRYGKFSKITVLENENIENDSNGRLISQGASYIVLKMLEDVKRPGIEYFWNLFEDSHPVSWKTGTSYGHKDAWAMGVTPEWTVGVWCGNFTGESNKSLSGARSAGPVLFDIINSITSERSESFYFPRGALRLEEVCSETGYLPGLNCEKTETVMLPVNSRPLPLCPYHDSMELSADGKETVCSLCWEKGHYTESVLKYPPLVARTMKKAGKTGSERPAHRKTCSSNNANGKVNIVYPQNGTEAIIPTDIGGKMQKIKLDAAHSSTVSKLFWYIDGVYFGSTSGDHTLFQNLEIGSHILKVIDSEGNTDQVSFDVK